ncbi:hypothetical protein [Bacterioplanoides sp.]|uniref:CIS tube protein n=1 Tax=Bacterioplanoides sp. TaxID=2066072 RepID=UPI003B5B4EB9
MAVQNGALEKMVLTGYKNGQFSEKTGDTYTVMLNPEKFNLNSSVSYNDKSAPGSVGGTPEYTSTPGDDLSFELLLDCTGIVDQKRTDLQKELKDFKQVAYEYNGSIHRPNFVVIRWGEGLDFSGVLNDMKVSYTLFSPSGKPLRARLSLSFSSYVDPEEAEKKKGKNSPDMTHMISVVEGDDLPALAYQTYQDASLCIPLARFNDLDRFRRLKPNNNLVFPPLDQSSGRQHG